MQYIEQNGSIDTLNNNGVEYMETSILKISIFYIVSEISYFVVTLTVVVTDNM